MKIVQVYLFIDGWCGCDEVLVAELWGHPHAGFSSNVGKKGKFLHTTSVLTQGHSTNDDAGFVNGRLEKITWANFPQIIRFHFVASDAPTDILSFPELLTNSQRALQPINYFRMMISHLLTASKYSWLSSDFFYYINGCRSRVGCCTRLRFYIKSDHHFILWFLLIMDLYIWWSRIKGTNWILWCHVARLHMCWYKESNSVSED